MTSPRHFSLIVAACCLAGGVPLRDALASPFDASRSVVSPSGGSAPPNVCEQAGTQAEQASGLPPGLLLAIGRVESGKWDPARARVTPWPWTMNAAGKGQWFETKEAAARTVDALLNGGTRSIDVGCFQISLLYHPTAFADLGQAFDPDSNARYAARFLLSLYGRTGSWEAAVAAYHSADPVPGFVYRQQVFAAWPSVPRFATSAVFHDEIAPRRDPAPAPIPAVYAGVQVWTPMPAGTGARIVAMPPPPAQDVSPVTLVAAPMALPVVLYRAMPRR